MSCSQLERQDMEIDFVPGREIATDVTLIYSDSAKIKFQIVTPLMETFEEEEILVEEYPQGLKIQFFNELEEKTSTIEADYAVREGKKGIMTLREKVILINNAGDKLTTTGIVWSELDQTLNTSKFVQLVKASSQDTFYGFGFQAKDDFSKFSIRQLTGKRRYQNLTEELGLEEK